MIYTVNNVATNVESGNVIPLGNIARKLGCKVEMFGNGLVAKKAGYYRAKASATLTGTTAGLITIQIYKNGVPIPGAIASVTTAEPTNVHTLTIDIPTRVFCYESNAIYTLVNSGVEITTSNVTFELGGI